VHQQPATKGRYDQQDDVCRDPQCPVPAKSCPLETYKQEPMKTSSSLTLLSLVVLAPAIAGSAPIRWQKLQPGVAYAAVDLQTVAVRPSRAGDGRLHLVRIAPQEARLRALVASQLKTGNKTAGQWADTHGLVAAINLGMYQMDHRTHVGYLRSGEHVDSRRWVSSYHSVLAFDPRRAGLAPAVLLDRLRTQREQTLGSYGVVVQNLRLIRGIDGRRGRGVWSRRRIRAWSEAALASDDQGRFRCGRPACAWTSPAASRPALSSTTTTRGNGRCPMSWA
jgi:hypothetical protein